MKKIILPFVAVLTAVAATAQETYENARFGHRGS